MRIKTPLVVASIIFLITLVAPTEALAQAILPVSRGGTGTGSFTVGSLLFYNGSTITEDNSNLFWDDINNRLGIGTSSPTTTLDVSGNTKITGNLNVTGTITGTISAANLVPYTGATGNVDLGSHSLTANSLTSSGDATINSLTVGLGGGSIAGNTVLGHNALLNNTNGARNVAIGESALFATQQSDNTAVGANALGGSSNSGEQNTAVGSSTLVGNTIGVENVAMGYKALQSNATGIRNVGIGVFSLFDNTGSNNVAIGTRALDTNTTGASNIGIGSFARTNSASDENSIVIGYGNTGAGTNTAVIGNSSMGNIYFGSAAGLANIHAKKMFLGSSTIPGCIIMGDVNGGVGYITLVNGVLTASTTAPSACQ